MDPPLVRHPYDDEFDTDTLDPAWTMGGIAGATWNTTDPIDPYAAITTGGARYATQTMPFGKKSWFRIQPQNAAQQVTLDKAVVVPTNAFVSSKMHFTSRLASQAVNDAVVGFGLYQDATFANGINIALNKGTANAIQAQGTRHIAGVATTIGGVSGDEDNRGQPFHTVGIQKTGTQYDVWALASELNWYWLGRITWTGTPLVLRIYAFNNATTAPGNSVVGVDYIRFSRTGFRT